MLDERALLGFMFRTYFCGRRCVYVNIIKAVHDYLVDRDGTDVNVPYWTKKRQQASKKPVQHLITKLERILHVEHNITVVRVGWKIERYIKHGQCPVIDAYRTVDFYRKSLPGRNNWACGLVFFPAETFGDHPLLGTKRLRRAKSLQTATKSHVESVALDRDRKLLSDPAVSRVASAYPASRKALARPENGSDGKEEGA